MMQMFGLLIFDNNKCTANPAKPSTYVGKHTVIIAIKIITREVSEHPAVL